MTLWKSIAGTVEVELTAAEPERALSAISQAGIALFGVRHEKDLTCSFAVRRRDYTRLAVLCQKNGQSLAIVRKQGISYSMAALRKRKMLIVGMGILLFSAFFLPTRILFVRVEGNSRIPENRIIRAAEDSGIRFGASRKNVRSEKVKNSLLDKIPQLQWAGVNTSGCTAVISVRERAANREEPESSGVSSIVADRDGYILSCTVTQGTAQVQPGQSVQNGQTLISGYTECGICIQATQAKGEIIAQTHRELTAIAPVNCLHRTGSTGISRRLSLLLGKKRIFFLKGSGISDAGCGRMYKQYNFTLPGGFRLPIALCVDTYQHYSLEDGKAEVSAFGGFTRQYLETQMVAGQILRETQRIVPDGDVLRLKGSYVCIESIGKVKPEQIGETNVKTNGENR
ncbi:MAG: sporulation protein YqfD [Candidatus Faecousia sp.]|nr:sporulation protein YqfD [Clostridiales bacterium]MDY4598042.1 sporulation protein YqfD [Candidatus Faecousia sp.]